MPQQTKCSAKRLMKRHEKNVNNIFYRFDFLIATIIQIFPIGMKPKLHTGREVRDPTSRFGRKSHISNMLISDIMCALYLPSKVSELSVSSDEDLVNTLPPLHRYGNWCVDVFLHLPSFLIVTAEVCRNLSLYLVHVNILFCAVCRTCPC